MRRPYTSRTLTFTDTAARGILAAGVLLVCLSATVARAQEIGKLFSTPEEREYLDYLRAEFLLNSQEQGFDIDRTVTPEIPVVEEAPEPEPSVIEYSLGGIMNRRDGSRTVWLNNQAVNEADLPSNFTLLERNGALTLRIEDDRGTFYLRPGQQVNLTSGVVSESFQIRNTQEALSASIGEQADAQEAGDSLPALQESGGIAGSADDALQQQSAVQGTEDVQ